jgi:hypothetical protein
LFLIAVHPLGSYGNIQFEMEKTLGESVIVQGKAMLPSLTELVESVNKLVTDFEHFLE